MQNKEENRMELSKKFTNFVSKYFIKINQTACKNNEIELPAELSELPDLREVYKKAVYNNAPDLPYYFHANHLGSGSLITEKGGGTYQTLAYAPYGEEIVNIRNGNYDELHRFGGHLKDEESGLYNYGARYFDDNLGAISPDVYAVKKPDITSYNNCSNNPINRIDPDGNFDFEHFAYSAGKFFGRHPGASARIDGGLKVVGGLVEGVAGLASAFVGNGYGLLAFAHGCDVGGTGLDQLWTGQFQSTATSQVMQSVGIPEGIANGLDAGISVFAGGASALSLTSKTLMPATEVRVSLSPATRGKSFFEGTKYSTKVLNQMHKDGFHSFSESVKAFESTGVVSNITGGDGVTRQMLSIPGKYGNKSGFFEFIKETNGTINHRFFRAVE